jgi:DNA modification methylase
MIELNKIYNEDCLDTMAKMPDSILDLTVTSPPYFNAKSYSNYTTYKDYLDSMISCINNIHRVTKEGKFLIINSSPVIQAREKRSMSSIRYGIPYDLHCLIVNNGWDFIEDIVWVKPEPSVKNRIAGFMKYKKPLTYKPNVVTEMIMVYRKSTNKLIDWNLKQYNKEIVKSSLITEVNNTTNVWSIRPTYNKRHPAVFPINLVKDLIRLYSYKNDIIYDPFMGSGTTALAAKELNRNYLGSEISKEYYELIIERLEA